MLFNMEDDKYDSNDILSQTLGHQEQNIKLADFDSDLTQFLEEWSTSTAVPQVTTETAGEV